MRFLDAVLARLGLCRTNNVVDALVDLRAAERERFEDTLSDKTWVRTINRALGKTADSSTMKVLS